MEDKTKHSRMKRLLITSMLILIILITGCYNKQILTNSLSDLGVKLDINQQFIVLKQSVIENGEHNITKIRATDNYDTIKILIIDNLNESEAQNYVNNEIDLINSLFTPYNNPYPGPVSKILNCSQRYFPSTSGDTIKDYQRENVYLYANNRFVFGVCTNNSIKYTTRILYIYCKEKKQLYRIDYFTPKNNPTKNYNEIIDSFECER